MWLPCKKRRSTYFWRSGHVRTVVTCRPQNLKFLISNLLLFAMDIPIRGAIYTHLCPSVVFHVKQDRYLQAGWHAVQCQSPWIPFGNLTVRSFLSKAGMKNRATVLVGPHRWPDPVYTYVKLVTNYRDVLSRSQKHQGEIIFPSSFTVSPTHQLELTRSPDGCAT